MEKKSGAAIRRRRSFNIEDYKDADCDHRMIKKVANIVNKVWTRMMWFYVTHSPFSQG